MSPWIEIAIFAGKAIVLTIAIIAILIVIANIAMQARKPREHLEVTDLNEKFDSVIDMVQSLTLAEKEYKKERKARKKSHKEQDKSSRKKVYVLEFDGDIRASQVASLREEVTAILGVARKDLDEVVVCIESPGGMVHGYGLAATQLKRIRDHGLQLTACVDKVAASGGYMMACTANQILAAPFAIVGSIGVIAQVPNLHRFLKKHDIDYEEITAGEFKRTISLLGEITDKGRKKFLTEIEDTHALFKEFVSTLRPQIDLAKVATGEHWFGQRAIDLGLVDRLMASDDYLFSMHDNADIYRIEFKKKKKLAEALAQSASRIIGEMNRYF